MGYNPNASSTIGVEWDVATEAVTSLSATSSAVAMLIDSSVTETINGIYLPHTWDGPSTGYGKLCVDVYNLADTGAGATLTTTRYQPNEDKSVSGLYKTTAGSGGSWSSVSSPNAYPVINDSDDTDDWLNFTWTSVHRMAFNTGAMSSSLQVASVSIELRVFGHYGTTPELYVDWYNNTTFVARAGSIRPPGTGDGTHTTFSTYTLGPFTTNPLTGVAWTASDIINMDTGTNLLLQITGNVGNASVAYVNLVVVTGADKRVATGTTATQTTKPSGMQTNLLVTLAANWSKVSGTDYLLVARRIEDPTGNATTLIPQLRYLADDDCPHVHGRSYDVTLSSSGLLDAVGSADTTKTYGVWLKRSDGAMSADSQPYWDVVLKPVYTGVGNVRQSVNGATNSPYKGVRLLVGMYGTPSANLTIKLKKSSDNSQVGGDATVTTADVAAGTYMGTISDATYGDVDIYSVLVNLASSATLAAATTYYFDVTSSAASTAPWLLVMLDATAGHSLTGTADYGGTTTQATAAGSTVAAGDFVIRISTTINAPGTVTGAAASTTVNGATVSYVDVDWTSGGALGASFSAWEVQRSADGGTTWVDVASITTEATLTFADYEAAKGTAAKYRVRMVRSDGAVSDWTTQSDTATPTATTGVVIFTTNEDPTLTVAYPVVGDDTAYQFAGADETVFMRLHGRDYVAAFRPTEQRGIVWPFEVQLSPSGGTDGVQAFSALRAIAEADVPYICLHTGDGERFFGALQVPEGNRVNSARRYRAKVVFTETQGDSSAVSL